MDGPPAQQGKTVSGSRVLLVGALLVLGVALVAWMLRPEPAARRGDRPASPRLTIGTSGEAARH